MTDYQKAHIDDDSLCVVSISGARVYERGWFGYEQFRARRIYRAKPFKPFRGLREAEKAEAIVWDRMEQIDLELNND